MKFLVLLFWVMFLSGMINPLFGQSQRLIAIGGGITETVCELGHCQNLVAVDATSQFPKIVQELPNLGYYRQLNAESILKARPNVVLLTDQAGPKVVIDQLKSLGIRLYFLNDKKSLDGAVERVTALGKILKETEKAEKLIEKMKSQLAQAQMESGKIGTKPRALFIYARGKQHLMTAGTDTAADEMFKLLGIENAGKDMKGYRSLNAEELIKMNPDLIVMTEGGLESLGSKTTQKIPIPGFEMTEAGRQKRIIQVDDLLFLGFSYRLGEASLKFVEQLRGFSWTPNSH